MKLREYVKIHRSRWANTSGNKGNNDKSARLHGTAFMGAWDEMFGLRTIPILYNSAED